MADPILVSTLLAILLVFFGHTVNGEVIKKNDECHDDCYFREEASKVGSAGTTVSATSLLDCMAKCMTDPTCRGADYVSSVCKHSSYSSYTLTSSAENHYEIICNCSFTCPTSAAPSTQGTTTQLPTTAGPTTMAKTTMAKTTMAQTTMDKTTMAKTTMAKTTMAKTTMAGTTMAKTTMAKTTMAGTTMDKTTMAKTTMDKTTMAKTTMDKTTMAKTTMDKTTMDKTTAVPTTPAGTTAMPTTAAKTTAPPTTAPPTTVPPTTTDQPTTVYSIVRGQVNGYILIVGAKVGLGTLVAGATTQSLCIKDCEEDPKCVGVDWDSVNKKCYKNVSPNVYNVDTANVDANFEHFMKVSDCSSLPITTGAPATTTTGVQPTTAATCAILTDGKYDNIGPLPAGWSSFPRYHIPFGIYKNTMSGKQCVYTCLSDAKCLAADYNVDTGACWIFEAKRACNSLKAKKNVNHFKKDTSTCVAQSPGCIFS